MIYLNNAPVKITQFPNGEFNVEVPEYFQYVGDVNLRLHYESDVDILHLKFVADHLANWSVRIFNLYIDYMPYERMDRASGESIFTLRSVADLINSINAQHVYVVEPHSDVTTALLRRTEPLWATEFFAERVLKDIDPRVGTTLIIFPDAGASKRYEGFFPEFKTIAASKHRDPKTGKLSNFKIPDLIEQSYNADSKVLIVDDLSSYGGTFVGIAEKLIDYGYKKENISLFVAHAENSIYKGKLLDAMHRVYCTDSMTREHDTHPRVTVLPLKDLYASI